MLEGDLAFRRGGFSLQASFVLDARVTGIVGASGAGKSTLLALVAGLLHPGRGWLRIDGEVLVDVAARTWVPSWRRRIGMVFQDGQLFPHMHVADNLHYGYARTPPAQRRIAPDDVIALLRLGDLLQRRPAQLSGGERQRVALGRALLCSPRLLLLDEPLSSLDDALKQQILPFLRDIKATLPTRMLYVSHSRAEVEYLSDEILEIARGEVRMLSPARPSAATG